MATRTPPVGVDHPTVVPANRHGRGSDEEDEDVDDRRRHDENEAVDERDRDGR